MSVSFCLSSLFDRDRAEKQSLSQEQTYLEEADKLLLSGVTGWQLIVAPLAEEVQPVDGVFAIVCCKGRVGVQGSGIAGRGWESDAVEVSALCRVPEEAFGGVVDEEAGRRRYIRDGVVVGADCGPLGVRAAAGICDDLAG